MFPSSHIKIITVIYAEYIVVYAFVGQECVGLEVISKEGRRCALQNTTALIPGLRY